MADGIRVGDRVVVHYDGEVIELLPAMGAVKIHLEVGGDVEWRIASIRHVRRLDDPAAEPILGPHSE